MAGHIHLSSLNSISVSISAMFANKDVRVQSLNEKWVNECQQYSEKCNKGYSWTISQ
jgi:hypothetical protein